MEGYFLPLTIKLQIQPTVLPSWVELKWEPSAVWECQGLSDPLNLHAI